MAALRSSLAARKAAQNPARLSLIATPLDKTKNESNEALSRSQPDLFIGIDQSGLQSPPGIVEAIDKNNKNINPLYANTSELTLNPHPSNIPPPNLPPTTHPTGPVPPTTGNPTNNAENMIMMNNSITTTTMSAIDLHQMETLKAENERLRYQLSDYTKKISRVATLEQEMAKIHQAYNSLLKHSEKRELLEKSARAKLQSVIINLSDANKVS